jgi:ElaB/YqjD/DUF883 family membrane-anchored ribosome-binding protein
VQRKKPASSPRRRAGHAVGRRPNAAATLRAQSARLATDLRELGGLAVAGAEEALDSARERGLEVLEEGRERCLEARARVERYVATHPFKSLLLAAGLGWLIGYSRGRR